MFVYLSSVTFVCYSKVIFISFFCSSAKTEFSSAIFVIIFNIVTVLSAKNEFRFLLSSNCVDFALFKWKRWQFIKKKFMSGVCVWFFGLVVVKTLSLLFFFSLLFHDGALKDVRVNRKTIRNMKKSNTWTEK